MLRKCTAILFLYLASMIMLAFAVFPHHHHNEYICFSVSHCSQEEGIPFHSHDNNPFTGDEGCVKHLFQTQISKIQTLDHSCEGHCLHFVSSFYLSARIFRLLSEKTEGKKLPDLLYQEKLHAIFLTTDLAGRAPPYIG